jgi:outer membrane immunogenic protein
MNSLLNSTAVYLLLPLTAFAADLPYRAAAPVAPVAATTWTGFYFGANAGLALDRFSVDGDNTKSKTVYGAYALNLHDNSATFGIQGGYNYQINNIVVGVEADIAATPWAEKSSVYEGTDRAEGRVSALATLRGRVGFAFDKTLVYATGGVGLVYASLNDTKFADSIDKTKAVGVFGLGIEQKLNARVSIGLEGLTTTKAGTTTAYTAVTPSVTSRASFSAGATSVVRAKINFAF